MMEYSNNLELGELIVQKLKSVYDPEIPVDIYELGLIYDAQINEKEGFVKIIMSLTSPNCPVAETLPIEVKNKIMEIKGIKDCTVDITFEPAWTKDMMSDEAKFALGML